MRVFVYNLNNSIEQILSKKLIEAGHDVVGTVNNEKELSLLSLPALLKEDDKNSQEENRFALLKDKKKISQLLLSSDVVIYSLFNQLSAVREALLLLSDVKEEENKLFLAISLIQTWGKTSHSDVLLTEDDYKQRKPLRKYIEYKTIETEILSAQKKGLKTCVVCPGLIYGGNSKDFNDILREAWLSPTKALLIPSLRDLLGENYLPMIHIKDIANILTKLISSNPSKQYLIIVDQSFLTLRQVTLLISKTLGNGEIKEMTQEESNEILVRNSEIGSLQINLRFTTKGSVLEQLNLTDEEFRFQKGLEINIKEVVKDYIQTLDLRPLRVVISGPPFVGKTTLALEQAKIYYLPYISLQNSFEKLFHDFPTHELVVEMEQTLGTPLQEQSASLLSSILIEKLLQWRLSLSDCRNQGYVLDGYPESYDEALYLYGKKRATIMDEQQEKQKEEQKDEQNEVPVSNLALMPTHVILLDASDEFLEERGMNKTENEAMEESQFHARLSLFRKNNKLESSESLACFFEQIGKLEVLEIEVSQEQQHVRTTIERYLENGGKVFNFHPTTEELIILKKEQEERKLKQEEIQKQKREEAINNERTKYEEEQYKEKSRLELIQKEEEELLEARSKPLRAYLMETVIPALTEGMLEVIKTQPDDPIDFLAEFLFKKGAELENHELLAK